MLLLLPVMATGVTWTLAVHALAHGTHHVSLHSAAGGLTIILGHDDAESTDSHDDAHAMDDIARVPAATHSHSQHQDHVVAFSTLDPCSPTAARHLEKDCGPAIVLQTAIGSANHNTPLSRCVACSGVGPPAPSRSSILRI